MNYQRKTNTFTAFLINYSIVLRREPTQQEVEHQIELYIATTSKNFKVHFELDPDHSLWREMRQEMNLDTYYSTFESFNQVRNKYERILQRRFYKEEYNINRQAFLEEFNEKLQSIIEDKKKKIRERGTKPSKNTTPINCPKCDTIIQKCEISRHQKTTKCELMTKAKVIPVDIPVVDIVEEKEERCGHNRLKNNCLECVDEAETKEKIIPKELERCGHNRLKKNCLECVDEAEAKEEVKVEKKSKRCEHGLKKRKCKQCLDEAEAKEEVKVEKKSKRCEHGLKKRKCKQCC